MSNFKLKEALAATVKLVLSVLSRSDIANDRRSYHGRLRMPATVTRDRVPPRSDPIWCFGFKLVHLNVYPPIWSRKHRLATTHLLRYKPPALFTYPTVNMFNKFSQSVLGSLPTQAFFETFAPSKHLPPLKRVPKNTFSGISARSTTADIETQLVSIPLFERITVTFSPTFADTSCIQIRLLSQIQTRVPLRGRRRAHWREASPEDVPLL